MLSGLKEEGSSGPEDTLLAIRKGESCASRAENSEVSCVSDRRVNGGVALETTYGQCGLLTAQLRVEKYGVSDVPSLQVEIGGFSSGGREDGVGNASTGGLRDLVGARVHFLLLIDYLHLYVGLWRVSVSFVYFTQIAS